MPAPPMRAPAWAWASTGGKTARVGYVNALNYEKGGEYKQGAGGDVLGQGVIAACGDGVSGLELCIARCVLCPGHIGDGGQQTGDHGQSQQQRQNFVIDLLHCLFSFFIFWELVHLRIGSGLRTLCGLSQTGRETQGKTVACHCKTAWSTAAFGQGKAAESHSAYIPNLL